MKNLLLFVTLLLATTAASQTPKSHIARDACSVPDQPVAVTHCEPAAIYVADFDRAAIESVLSRHFDGFTILPARGCWHKVCENSLVIQIAGASEAEVRKAAEELRVAGKQESVLVVMPGSPAPRR